MQRSDEEEEEEKNNREQGSRMDWHEATSASGERPAVHPDCRRPIKIYLTQYYFAIKHLIFNNSSRSTNCIQPSVVGHVNAGAPMARCSKPYADFVGRPGRQTPRVVLVGAAEYPEMSTGWGNDLTFREIQLTGARLKVGVIVDGSHNREMG
ncbi:hypothetical protein ALC62_15071 [Cyphomyrmex costatus]|uniref:Uncharacterized protein n=1 Tax=Cyphomyrmex costatus TaxID=456900 RepID=A0A151I865_9HYME|nr:hypothetical protein ALC62_15071 [Cyphomyrmex costatus]